MKAFLMYQDRDFDYKKPLPINEKVLIQDLELTTLINTMAQGDDFLFDVAKTAVISSELSLDTILYRQNILQDCLNNPNIIREIYQIPIDSIANKNKNWMGIFTHYPSGVLSSAVELMDMFFILLKKLKGIADSHSDKFVSQGFTTFFSMLKTELTDEYFAIVEEHLKELRFRKGVLISADLGKGNEGTNYILRRPVRRKRGWVHETFSKKDPVYTFWVHPRDDAGLRALSDIRDRGINQVANAVAQSADHIDNFFKMLRIELGFYIGCLNLYEQLKKIGAKVCFPLPFMPEERKHTFQGLYDINLALTKNQLVMGNDLTADKKELFIITGANQGGKSTFLRSVGVAQLMMQCGMYVPAASFSANICTGLFTHYKRKEDPTMKSGKLDEELSRMSDIANTVTVNSMVLFNESFAATNEREGSEIARQITNALIDRQIKVFFVTHLFDFAHSLYIKDRKKYFFLRAERKASGGRTYKVTEGAPLPTSFGKDIYKAVFTNQK